MNNASIKSNTLKQRILNGEVVHCAWHQIGGVEAAEITLHAGWEALIIDGEHAPLDYHDIVNCTRAVEAAGGQYICRIPTYDPMMLNKYLDAGIRTIMVPNIRSYEQALSVAQACHYPPQGRRGYSASVVRASNYGMDKDYLEKSKKELFLILQIEHIDAIKEIEKIAKIPGVDMLFLGLNDMGGSVGKLEQLHTPEVMDLYRKTTEELRKSGILMGSIPGPKVNEKQLIEDGYRLIAGPSNVILLREAARAALEDLQKVLKS